MQVAGKVIERLDEKHILVEIIRTSACGGDCHSCGSCGGNQSRIVAQCTDYVKENEMVRITISDRRYFGLSFLVFILPLFVIIAFYVWLSSQYSEGISAGLSFLLGVFFFVGIVLGMRKLKMPRATLLNERYEKEE